MKAIHWLRSNQEENELGYWLSFVAYDQKDRSLINKAYLLYLIIFFFFWFMAVFFFFAKVSGMVLSFLNPGQAANTAVTIEWIVLACWNLYSLFQSARRSPIVFSETDQALVCQTPVSRRALVIRWLWMPWLKSVLPFSLIALVLGFSTAELHFSGVDYSNIIFSYMAFGLRAMVQIIPVHLAMYSFQWAVGVFRLHKNDHRDWVIYPAIVLGIITLALAFLTIPNTSLSGLSPLKFAMTSDYINGIGPSPLLFGISSALLLLGLLFWISRHFNLNRAAQETSEIELMGTAAKFGFTDLVDQRRLQNRLTTKRNIPMSSRHKGVAVLLWKNQLQQFRGFTWKHLWPLITIFSIMLGLPLVPGFVSKLLILYFLVNQIGPLLTPRLRSDLACWPILQQLPIRKPKLLIYDLWSNLPLLFGICLLGLGVSAIITHTFAFNLLLILPGLLTTIGFTAAIDIFRKSKSDLLLNGNVPSIGTQGVILGLVGTIIPVFLTTTLKSPVGALISMVLSLVITWISYKFAVLSFKNIKSND